jgi:hypothetical protein
MTFPGIETQICGTNRKQPEIINSQPNIEPQQCSRHSTLKHHDKNSAEFSLLVLPQLSFLPLFTPGQIAIITFYCFPLLLLTLLSFSPSLFMPRVILIQVWVDN